MATRKTLIKSRASVRLLRIAASGPAAERSIVLATIDDATEPAALVRG